MDLTLSLFILISVVIMRPICHSETDIHLIMYAYYILDVNKGTVFAGS